MLGAAATTKLSFTSVLAIKGEGDRFGDFVPNPITSLLLPEGFRIVSYTVSGRASLISGILTVEFSGPGLTSFQPPSGRLVDEPVPCTSSILFLSSEDFFNSFIDYFIYSCFIYTSSQICEAGDLSTEGRSCEPLFEIKVF